MAEFGSVSGPACRRWRGMYEKTRNPHSALCSRRASDLPNELSHSSFIACLRCVFLCPSSLSWAPLSSLPQWVDIMKARAGFVVGSCVFIAGAKRITGRTYKHIRTHLRHEPAGYVSCVTCHIYDLNYRCVRVHCCSSVATTVVAYTPVLAYSMQHYSTAVVRAVSSYHRGCVV